MRHSRVVTRLTNVTNRPLVRPLNALLTFSVLLNICSLYHSSTQDVALLHSIIDTLPSKPPASGLDHLVIVPGHGIWTGAHPEDAENEGSWLLASYQRGRSVHPYSAHTSLMAPKSPRKIPKHSSSSAEVTHPLGATSDGGSYLRFARATGLLPPADRFTRAATEDAALDSFQNVLFSVARFRESTGAYPTRITHRPRPQFQAASLRATPPTRTALAQAILYPARD
ncbi:hypothetical protein EDB86DRAFT_3078049 [Lactarius hatsudake]|nr:hypothetical protein EDB86DRAFT_3078049 [Lactarius hatsudake]